MKPWLRWQRGSRLGRGHLGEKEQTGRQGRVLGRGCWAPPCAQQPSVWGCSWSSGLPSPLTQPPTHSSRRPPITGPVSSRGKTDDPDPHVPHGQLFQPRQHLEEQQVDHRRPSDGPETPAPQTRESSGPCAPGEPRPRRLPSGSHRRAHRGRDLRQGLCVVHPPRSCLPLALGVCGHDASSSGPASLSTRHEFRGRQAVKFPRWSLWKQGLLSSVDPEDRRLREVPRLSGRATSACPGLGCRSPRLKAPTGRLQSCGCRPRS